MSSVFTVPALARHDAEDQREMALAELKLRRAQKSGDANAIHFAQQRVNELTDERDRRAGRVW